MAVDPVAFLPPHKEIAPEALREIQAQPGAAAAADFGPWLARSLRSCSTRSGACRT